MATVDTRGFHSNNRTRRFSAVLALILAVTSAAAAADAACTGDCDGDDRVLINETIAGVDIALGSAPLSGCASLDANDDSSVGIDELIAAVSNALNGCPANLPPVLPAASIYRTYAGFDVGLAIGAVDPEGRPVRCVAADLPAGASFDEQSGVLSWTPSNDQLGPFYVPVSCADDAVPPASVDGQLTLQVTALDACTMPSCDPASGCTVTLPPVSQPCCAAGPVERVAEPVVACPASRVLFVGQNESPDSFGRLQNCDILRMRNFQQSGAEVQLHVETRCVNTLGRVRLRVRLESNAANHALLFDVVTRQFFLSETADGFARQRGLRFPIGGGGPFSDLEGAEGNLTVTLIDADGVEVTDQLRLRLSFTPRPDLPDVDPTPTAQ